MTWVPIGIRLFGLVHTDSGAGARARRLSGSATLILRRIGDARNLSRRPALIPRTTASAVASCAAI